MAKSQIRSGREAKKPKIHKKKHKTAAYLLAEQEPVRKAVPEATTMKH